MIYIKSRWTLFWKNESGAALDWVVLTAGAVAMATGLFVTFAYNIHSPMWQILHDIKVSLYWFRP
jgi:hypothetical protein